MNVFEARATPFGEATPLKPMLDLLRDFFGIRPLIDAQERAAAVAIALNRLEVDQDVQTMILELLGLSASKQQKTLDPVTRKARLRKFICELIRRDDRRSSVVLIEDVHWLDTASMELLEAMVDASYGSKTMLLLNFRPGLVRDWMQRSHYRVMNLSALNAEKRDALIVEALGDHESTRIVRADLAARSQGNPFFIEELIWALVEAGGLVGEPGAYRATEALNLAALPANIQGIISTRVDSLDAVSKKVLQIGAVISREIPVEVLFEISGVSEDDFEGSIRNLRRLELMYELPRVQKTTFLRFDTLLSKKLLITIC